MEDKPRRSRSPIGRVTQPRPITCDRCGTLHQRCTGHKTVDGVLGPCGAWPVRGAEVCVAHGGRAPQVKAAAAARLAEYEARRDVERYGGSIEIDPATALLQLVHQAAAAVEYCRLQVNRLEAEELVWGVVEETDRPLVYGAEGQEIGGGVEVKRKAAPHTWVVLYQQERQILAKVSKAAIDAGATASMVEIFRQVGATYVQLVGRVLDQVFAALNLSEEQRSRAPELVRVALQAELDSITGGNEET